MRKRRRCFVLGGVVLAFCLLIYYPILLSIQPEEIDIWNRTRDLVVFVNPYNYTAILDVTQACGDGDDVFLLVAVCSAAGNFENRLAIRDTWGRPQALRAEPRDFPESSAEDTSNSTRVERVSSSGTLRRPELNIDDSPTNAVTRDTAHAVRLIFILGNPDNDTIQEQIEKESSAYGDVVQEDFFDTYNNLTIKSVMMLKWVNATCRRTRYVMKTDDDTFVNVPRLVSYLRRNGRRNLLLGCLICSAVPVKNRNSKWYTPKTLFGERVYPNYLSGTGYVISGDMVPRLYSAALATPFFHLEDIFVTGICARRLRVKPVDYEGFTYQKRPLDACLYHVAITGHKVSANDTRYMWHEMHAEGLQCHNASHIRLRGFKPSKCL